MSIRIYIKSLTILVMLAVLFSMPVVLSAAITSDELKIKVSEATSNFYDISMVVTVTSKDKDALKKIEPGYTMFFESKSANVVYKSPDKMKFDGKLGMVRIEYIVNGTKKIVRAPKVGINKVSDHADDPAKLQDSLDIGLMTSAVWKNRRVEVLDDADAQANSEIKVRLYYPKGDMIYLGWLDSQNLSLKRFEKRDPKNKLLVRYVFSDPKNIDGKIWIPTKIDMIAPDGSKAASSEVGQFKVNTCPADNLFQ